MPLHFPAGGLGQASRHEQDDRMRAKVVRVGDRVANPPHGFVGIHFVPVGQVDLLYDDEPFLALLLDGKGRAAARCKGRVAGLGRVLDIFRIVVSSAEDHEVLAPAGDVDVAPVDETQIARPQKRAFRAGAEVSAERLSRLVRLAPVPVRHAVPAHHNSPTWPSLHSMPDVGLTIHF